ncbi:Yip1 family protein [Pulveribacter suum]|uniref:YIP1 family protein n=1 Tax=Pulveribacter suum TaxID=2116657 RepID=A0A2P1NIV8_9BURK|nr:Yip1 family protein [Pulveribacter suum]AVP57004.1 YIP1 family protein [Pulveribacter suum]
MRLIERATAIILRPRQAWAEIDTEPASTGQLVTGYLMILAAIPAVCAFIGLSLIGVGGAGYRFRLPLAAGLVNMVLSYVLSIVGVYVLSLVINALAPTFGGTRNPLQALKVAVYASTAAMLGGLFSLLPMLAILGLVAALYSLYLLYLGLPVLMRSPAARALPYTAVVVLAALVIGAVMAAVVSLASPAAPSALGRVGGAPAVVIDTPQGRVTVDTARLEERGKKMQEAAGTAAQAGGAPAATGAAGASANLAAFKAALPASVAGLPRTAFNAHDGAALGIPISQAEAEYGSGERTVTISIVDSGPMGQLAQMAGLVQGESETEDSVDKTWQDNGRTMQHSYAKDGSQAELRAILKNGMLVSVEGTNVPLQQVQAAMAQIDLGTLERLQRPAAKP